MAGVKGRSGRKSHFDEKTANEILSMAMSTIKMALADMTLPIQFRSELASKIYTKAMPSIVDANIDAKVTEMPAIIKSSENRISEFSIGSPIIVEESPAL